MSTQVTITLSDSQVSDIKALQLHMRDAETLELATKKCLEAGMIQLEYRYKYNKVKVQKDRENKQLLAILIKEREERLKAEQEESDEIVARD